MARTFSAVDLAVYPGGQVYEMTLGIFTHPVTGNIIVPALEAGRADLTCDLKKHTLANGVWTAEYIYRFGAIAPQGDPRFHTCVMDPLGQLHFTISGSADFQYQLHELDENPDGSVTHVVYDGYSAMYLYGVPDLTPPTITTLALKDPFWVPSAGTHYVPIVVLTAGDDVGITGYYCKPADPLQPAVDDANWSATVPTALPIWASGINITGYGTYDLTLWVKDANGNMAYKTDSFNADIDSDLPTVTAFELEAASGTSLTVNVTSCSATDATSGVYRYLIHDADDPTVDQPPSSADARWAAANQQVPYTQTSVPEGSQNARTLHLYAIDKAGNVSLYNAGTSVDTYTPIRDNGYPRITAFTLSAGSGGQQATISSFTADIPGGGASIVGYMVTHCDQDLDRSAPRWTVPSLSDPDWSGTAPTTYDLPSSDPADYYLIAWVKTSAGVVSTACISTFQAYSVI